MPNSTVTFKRSISDDFESMLSIVNYVNTSEDGMKEVDVISRYSSLGNEHDAIQNFNSMNLFLTPRYAARDATESAGGGDSYMWSREIIYTKHNKSTSRGYSDRFVWAGKFKETQDRGTVFKGTIIDGVATDGYMMIPRPYIDLNRELLPVSDLTTQSAQDGIRLKIKSDLTEGIPANRFIPLCGYTISVRKAFGWIKDTNRTGEHWFNNSFVYGGPHIKKYASGAADSVNNANNTVSNWWLWNWLRETDEVYGGTRSTPTSIFNFESSFDGLVNSIHSSNRYCGIDSNSDHWGTSIHTRDYYIGNYFGSSNVIFPQSLFFESERAINDPTVRFNESEHMGNVPKTIMPFTANIEEGQVYQGTNYAANIQESNTNGDFQGQTIQNHAIPYLTSSLWFMAGENQGGLEFFKTGVNTISLSTYYNLNVSGSYLNNSNNFVVGVWGHKDYVLNSGIENKLIWILYAHDGNGKFTLATCPGETGTGDSTTINQFNPQNSHFFNGRNGMFQWVQPHFFENFFDTNQTDSIQALWDYLSPGGEWYDNVMEWNGSTVHETRSFRRIYTHCMNYIDDKLYKIAGSPESPNIEHQIYKNLITDSDYRFPHFFSYWKGDSAREGLWEFLFGLNNYPVPNFARTQVATTSGNLHHDQNHTEDDTAKAFLDWIEKRDNGMLDISLSNGHLTLYRTQIKKGWTLMRAAARNHQAPVMGAATQLLGIGTTTPDQASLKTETELLLNINWQTAGSGSNHKSFSEFGLMGDFQNYSDSLALGKHTCLYLSGKFNGLSFKNVPSVFFNSGYYGLLGDGTSHTEVWETGATYFPGHIVNFWPALILRPVQSAGIEISKFSYAHFEHDYESQAPMLGGVDVYSDHLHEVHSDMPYKFGEYAYSYDPLRTLKGGGAAAEDPSSAWSNIDNLYDQNVGTSATLSQSGEANAIYLPLSTIIKDSEITTKSDFDIKSLNVNIKGIKMTGLDYQTIKMSIVDNSKTQIIFNTVADQTALNKEIRGIPLNGLASYPLDDFGYHVMFEHTSALQYTYEDIMDGYLKIWAEPT